MTEQYTVFHLPKRINLLEEFAKHENWELTHTLDFDDYDPSGWQVHSVNGGRNDREWTLIGFGEAPAQAIEKALESNC